MLSNEAAKPRQVGSHRWYAHDCALGYRDKGGVSRWGVTRQGVMAHQVCIPRAHSKTGTLQGGSLAQTPHNPS